MSMHFAPIDATHDAALSSWVESANAEDGDFPIQNLPIGVFRRAGSAEPLRPGVAIGDQIVDLLAARDAQLLDADVAASLAGCEHGEINAFMAQDAAARRALRLALSTALRSSAPRQAEWAACLVPQAAAEYAVPCRIGDYTDFYTGIHHATTVGKLFRPDNPLLPNYKWVPIGYHGRSSTIGVSGESFHRPLGQLKGPNDEAPVFAPSQRLDYELEVGVFVGRGNAKGQPIPIARAEDHLFGLVLFNDWSARDIQAWEYQPLGPFLAKSFASTISPWIVTMEALAPFRSAFTRAADDPAPLPYLDHPGHAAQAAIDIALEVALQTAQMRAAGEPAQRLSQSNFRDAYWSVAQMLAHHASNGCRMQSGDLLGSGTQSGAQAGQGGSLLELSQGGKAPITLANGEQRRFLEDGDTVVMRGRCSRAGYRSIGFGECRGTLLGVARRSI